MVKIYSDVESYNNLINKYLSSNGVINNFVDTIVKSYEGIDENSLRYPFGWDKDSEKKVYFKNVFIPAIADSILMLSDASQIIDIPAELNTSQGGDDYYHLSPSQNETKNLPTPLETKKKRNLKIFTDKLYQAEIFLKENPFFYDAGRIWWLWNKDNFSWEIVDEVDLLNKLNSHDEDSDIVNPSERSEIINSLKSIGRQNKPKEVKESWVQFYDKIYDIDNEEIINASPEYFITNPINWKVGETEDTPYLDLFFESWVGADKVKELYEILAFCMVPSYFIQRMFCLIGSGANGKTTFLKILEKFIGLSNLTTSSLTLLMSQRFEGCKLLKKLVCEIGETNFNIMNNTDFLKKLTGSDLIRAEFKGKDCFDFRNYAKLVMATNSLPPTTDKTMGFYRRWKIIDFPNQFSKEVDILTLIPEKEYENLALKCINIAKKLWKNKEFSNDGTFEEKKKRYEDISNPLNTFIKENYIKSEIYQILFTPFCENFNSYLEERGLRVLTSQSINKQLKNEGFEVRLTTSKGVNGRYIFGLDEKTEKVSEIAEITQNNEITQNLTGILNLNISSNNRNLRNFDEESREIGEQITSKYEITQHLPQNTHMKPKLDIRNSRNFVIPNKNAEEIGEEIPENIEDSEAEQKRKFLQEMAEDY